MTPEPFAEYLAQRVADTFQSPSHDDFEDNDSLEQEDADEKTISAKDKVNVLDAFGGVGGNTIQFAKRGFCVGVDNDAIKVNCIRNNAQVYGLREHEDFQVVERDFLRLENYEQI